MQLHNLKSRTPRKTSKRVGRGRASGKGKTAGRGTKGQKARAGRRIRPAVRDELKKLPKLRGYRFRSIQEKPKIVNVAALEMIFSAGETVTPALLRERGAIRARRDVSPRVKILGGGELTKKLTISGCAVSTAARRKIEEAGGMIA